MIKITFHDNKIDGREATVTAERLVHDFHEWADENKTKKWIKELRFDRQLLEFMAQYEPAPGCTFAPILSETEWATLREIDRQKRKSENK